MNESERELTLFAGATVGSTLYLIGVFVLGVATEHLTASYLAVASAGAVYVSNLAQYNRPHKQDLNAALFGLSAGTGLVAGAFLFT